MQNTHEQNSNVKAVEQRQRPEGEPTKRRRCGARHWVGTLASYEVANNELLWGCARQVVRRCSDAKGQQHKGCWHLHRVVGPLTQCCSWG